MQTIDTTATLISTTSQPATTPGTALTIRPRVFLASDAGPPTVSFQGVDVSRVTASEQPTYQGATAGAFRAVATSHAQVDSLIAHRQWASRPADERFWDLEECYQAALKHKESAILDRTGAPRKQFKYSEISVKASGPSVDDVSIVGQQGIPARLTHYAFSQLCTATGSPAEFLRGIDDDPDLVERILARGIRKASDKGGQMLIHSTARGPVARAVNGSDYSTIWDADVMRRLMDLPGDWRTPPARPRGIEGERTRIATLADVLPGNALGPQAGSVIAPAGVYRGDRNSFVFQVDPNRVIETGTGRALMRGYIAKNSEVGDGSFWLLCFLLDAVCGNHILHGASLGLEVRFRHVGIADQRATLAMRRELAAYASMDTTRERAMIQAAQRLMFGTGQKDTVDALFGKRIATKAQLEAAYAVAVKNEDAYGPPPSAWAMVNGLTEISQQSQNADARTAIDQAAGKILALARN